MGGPRAAVRAAGLPRPTGARAPGLRGRGHGIEPRDRAPQAGVSDAVRRLRGDRRPWPGPLDQRPFRSRARHAQSRGRTPPLRGRGDLGLVAIAARYTPMSVFVLNITTMVGLGVGIDYSLLIVTRFREELNRGLSPADAAIRTVETAGSAVVTSGLTVVVGFAALVTTPLSDTRSVGVGGLLVVAVAVLLATTFLPAVLAILGRNIDRPKWLARPLARFHAPTGWERWARWLGHRPWRAVAVGGAAIALLSFPLTQIRLGLPATNWFPPQSESGQAHAAPRDMGASGVIQPIRVVVQLPEGEAALAARRLPGLKALTDSLRKDPRVREVRGVASIRPGMSTLQLAIYYSDP